MSEIILEKLKLNLITYLSNENLMDLDVTTDYLLDSIAIKTRWYVWAEEDSAKKVEIKYPLDWWQAIKERWFPKWMINKYPVRYKNIVVDVKAIYPEFKQAIRGQTMRLVIFKNEWRDDERAGRE